MKRRATFITLSVVLAILLGAGCLKLGSGVPPVLKTELTFIDSVRLADIGLKSLARNAKLRLATDCETPADESVLCTRTKAQLEPIYRAIRKAAALIDEAEGAYSRNDGEAQTLLSAVVQSILLISNQVETLKMSDAEVP